MHLFDYLYNKNNYVTSKDLRFNGTLQFRWCKATPVSKICKGTCPPGRRSIPVKGNIGNVSGKFSNEMSNGF